MNINMPVRLDSKYDAMCGAIHICQILVLGCVRCNGIRQVSKWKSQKKMEVACLSLALSSVRGHPEHLTRLDPKKENSYLSKALKVGEIFYENTLNTVVSHQTCSYFKTY